MSMVIKSQVVLDLSDYPTYTNRLLFSNAGDMETGQHTSVFMPRDKWESMNQPGQITVTIEPGDLLNPPGEIDGQQRLGVEDAFPPGMEAYLQSTYPPRAVKDNPQA